MQKKITIRDVARAAGVSITTVSDAVNDSGRLSQATRSYVLSVATDLGYTASPVARGLRKGTMAAIGFYTPHSRNEESSLSVLDYFMRAAAGAADRAFASDLALSLLPTRPDPERIKQFPMAGLIVVDPIADDEVVKAFVARGPVVVCDQDPTVGARPAGVVDFDYARGIRDMLDHLAAEGSSRPALIVNGARTAWEATVQGAYRRWCARHDVPVSVSVSPVWSSPDATYETTRALLDAPDPPDAILAMPEGGIPGILRAATERGLSIPGELLVASCIDGPACVQADPQVSAIDLDAYRVGYTAAGLLASLLNGSEPTGTHVRLRHTMQLRRSTHLV